MYLLKAETLCPRSLRVWRPLVLASAEEAQNGPGSQNEGVDMKRKKQGLQIRVEELKATGLCLESDFATYGYRAKFEEFTFNFPLSPQARGLLASAYAQLQLTPYSLEKIERLTLAVMAAEGLKPGATCEPQHIAEAIGYIWEANVPRA